MRQQLFALAIAACCTIPFAMDTGAWSEDTWGESWHQEVSSVKEDSGDTIAIDDRLRGASMEDALAMVQSGALTLEDIEMFVKNNVTDWKAAACDNAKRELKKAKGNEKTYCKNQDLENSASETAMDLSVNEGTKGALKDISYSMTDKKRKGKIEKTHKTFRLNEDRGGHGSDDGKQTDTAAKTKITKKEESAKKNSVKKSADPLLAVVKPAANFASKVINPVKFAKALKVKEKGKVKGQTKGNAAVVAELQKLPGDQRDKTATVLCKAATEAVSKAHAKVTDLCPNQKTTIELMQLLWSDNG